MSEVERFSGDWWRSLRHDLDARFLASKDSQSTIFELAKAYGKIPFDSREEVDDVLVEWLLSEDESLRYDAIYIINEYLVRRTEPALRTLQDRLERAADPSSPYEWAKVNQVLGRLVKTT